MVRDFDLHARLIGQQGGRMGLNTPALVVEREAMQRNIDAMAKFCRERGLLLRPHAKTHKSIEIARLQLEAGAVGICCAKLGEAETLGEAGVASILITSPVVTSQAIQRLIALHNQIPDLRLVVDNAENVDALATAAKGAANALPVLIDVDPGIRRTGVISAEAAVRLAERIDAHSTLKYCGVQYYCGVQQHIASHADRREAIEERTAYLKGVLDALSASGHAPDVVTGGGTGTHGIDADLGVLTELQAGSYVFMDRQYSECELRDDCATPFETSLFVDARVISANHSSMATIDAGFKALSTDGGAPKVVQGAPPSAAFVFMGDEHGALIAADHVFRVGDLVTLSVPHCDPTVNLYDAYHVVRNDVLVDIWPVSARGCSR